MNVWRKLFGAKVENAEAARPTARLSKPNAQSTAQPQEHTGIARRAVREERIGQQELGQNICAKCGASYVTDTAPFSSAVSTIRCPNGHYTRVICVACTKGIMTRVSDMASTVSTICTRCGHASTGIPLKWWGENVRHTPEDLDELSRIHDPARRALFQFLTSADRKGFPLVEPTTVAAFRKTAAEHLDYILTTHVGADLQRSGLPCISDPEKKVTVKSVRAHLDNTSGCTLISLDYETTTELQVDPEIARKVIGRRLMEFYAKPLSAAAPEQGVGVVRWMLGELKIMPGQVI